MAEREKIARTTQHQVYKNLAGKRVSGVTTILGVIEKPALKFWANTIGLEGIMIRDYVDGLADIGTLAHEMIHAHLNGLEMNYDDWTPNQIKAATNSYEKFLEWSSGREIEVIAAEVPLVSEKHQFGGMPDIIAMVDSVRTVVDIKTAKAIYDSHLWQVCAYTKLIEENGYGDIAQGLIVQVGRSPDEGFTTRQITGDELERGWKVFLLAQQLKAATKPSDWKI
tara:strand:- start:4573 stop:5244 length:672 start_codon:yes stop_codon:yes gene_type:complete